jgi:hypothetical protein
MKTIGLRPASLAPGWLVLGLAAALLSGCVADHEVKVDSLAKPGTDAVSYSLRNANPTEKEDELRYREAANLVRTALSGRGLFEAPVGVVPDVIVDLDFGIGPPRVRREMKTESTVVEMKTAENPVFGTGGPTPMPGTTVQTGLREVAVEVVVYEKYLHLVAHENMSAKGSGTAAEIWRVDVTSEGNSSDVRKQLPILVAASIGSIGRDSHGAKTIRIKDTDADVVFVKKGM